MDGERVLGLRSPLLPLRCRNNEHATSSQQPLSNAHPLPWGFWPCWHPKCSESHQGRLLSLTERLPCPCARCFRSSWNRPRAARTAVSPAHAPCGVCHAVTCPLASAHLGLALSPAPLARPPGPLPGSSQP